MCITLGTLLQLSSCSPWDRLVTQQLRPGSIGGGPINTCAPRRLKYEIRHRAQLRVAQFVIQLGFAML